jgi:hypothetical protein
VYAKLGRELRGEARARMEAYVAGKPRGKHGAHRYALEDFGVETAWVRERYASYTTRYGVEAEG